MPPSERLEDAAFAAVNGAGNLPGQSRDALDEFGQDTRLFKALITAIPAMKLKEGLVQLLMEGWPEGVVGGVIVSSLLGDSGCIEKLLTQLISAESLSRIGIRIGRRDGPSKKGNSSMQRLAI